MSDVNKIIIISFILFLFSGCRKDEVVTYDDVRTIEISDKIKIDNGVQIHNPDLNLSAYEDFLKYLVTSNRFLIVTQSEFSKTFSNDKVVISLRHDVDNKINSSIKFAYREWKYGIRATYYILHTAGYYGVTKHNSFVRSDDLIYYLKKFQDTFGHEVGWHNDLVTLQVVYNFDTKAFLREELDWLRSNNINVYGTAAHGRDYCYKYHYLNSYFWKEIDGSNNSYFYNWEYIPNGMHPLKIEKDYLYNYDLYDANQFKYDYFFTDTDYKNGQRWNMKMVDFDTIKPGKKVIILLHPEHWD